MNSNQATRSNIINPLLLAIYYKDEWENVRERSKDYKDMLSTIQENLKH